jgi:hypothetical protein
MKHFLPVILASACLSGLAVAQPSAPPTSQSDRVTPRVLAEMLQSASNGPDIHTPGPTALIGTNGGNLAVTSHEPWDFETKFTDRCAHPIYSGVVLPWISDVGDELVDRPKLGVLCRWMRRMPVLPKSDPWDPSEGAPGALAWRTEPLGVF